jgi:hypothetical protein
MEYVVCSAFKGLAVLKVPQQWTEHDVYFGARPNALAGPGASSMEALIRFTEPDAAWAVSVRYGPGPGAHAAVKRMSANEIATVKWAQTTCSPWEPYRVAATFGMSHSPITLSVELEGQP